MKTLQLAMLLVISVFVLIIIAIFSAPTFIDWRSNKGVIENLISDFTGYKTKIGGDLQIQILPNPKLYAEDISLESMAGDKNIATISRIIVDKKLSDLFALDFSFDNLIVNRPEINLVVDETGSKNWEPLKVKSSNYYGPKLRNLISKTLGFKSIVIENGSFLYTNLKTDENKIISNVYSKINIQESTRIKTETKAVYKSQDHEVNLTVDAKSTNSLSIAGKLTAGEEDVYSIQGNLKNPYNFKRANFIGKVTAQVKDANSLEINSTLDKLKNKFIDLKNVETQADIDISLDKFKADILSFTAANQNLKGKVEVSKKGSNGKDIKLNLDILRLKLEAQDQQAKSNSKIEWSEEPLDFSFLSNISYDASIKCEECIYGKKSFRQINMSSSLDSNNLVIRQLSVKSATGGYLKLSATGALNSPVAFEVKTESVDFPLHSLIPGVFKDMVEFKLEGKSEIIASGVSTKAMFANMSGSLDFKLLDTKLNHTNPHSLKTVVKSAINKSGAYTSKLGDIKIEGQLRKGVFRASEILFAVNSRPVSSKGKFDLANLTMSYRIEPNNLSRSNLGIIMSGNINNLDIIEDKITPKGVVDGFGRVVTTSIVKKVVNSEVKTPFDFNDKANLDKNVKDYLFNEK